MEGRETVIREKYAALAAHLTERGRRIWAATEARSYGRGGIAAMYRATGITDKTIRRGIQEVEVGAGADGGRIRKAGGGGEATGEKGRASAEGRGRRVGPVRRG